MRKEATLLVLAAGMGSRYGGLKQLDTFGPNGETIIDYSLYDAYQAGFTKVVFIIREAFRKDFEEIFKPKLAGKMEVEFVAQDLDNLPEGYALPEERQKPWGTAHAILVAKETITGPFAVINADDYYGQDSYSTLIEYFNGDESRDYAVVGYLLKNTLSDHGTVNRGICHSDEHNSLVKIVETLKIGKANAEGLGSYPNPDGEGNLELAPDTLVSMNMFGFQDDFFPMTEAYFKSFLDEYINVPKSEFFIPFVLDTMINEKVKNIKVLTSHSEWFGVTYQEDKPFVVAKINELIEKKAYPEHLWA